ncbi:ribosome biogenesis GTPase Der, partial [Chloroflexota bacterium]
MSKPLIAIVGRPNVGKSTLFNRLVGRRAAVVTDVPGTTRDRISLDAVWSGRSFIIVDTGGLEPEPASPLAQRVKAQVEMAIEAADSIIFLTDAQDGPTPVDEEISERLRQAEKPVALAVNKADNAALAQEAVDFYRLGLGAPLPISAHHNRGINNLMEAVLATIPESREAEAEEDVLSLAIVGRVNVGKSALLNSILGEERTIVSETPGTTRDAIDTPVLYQGQKLLLIDTAGIRRRGLVAPGIERYSVLRAVQAVDRADVVFLVLDASDLATAQDTHIAGQVADAFKGAVIVVNKWDLAPQLGLDQADCLAEIRRRFKFMPYAPVRFASALQNSGVTDTLNAAFMVYQERNKTVSRQELSSAVTAAMAKHLPPSKGRRSLRLDRVAQEGVNPPTFVFYVNDAKLIHFSYHRYL